MKAKAAGRKTIKAANGAVNIAVLTIIVLLTAFAGYALWDSKQIYQAADRSNYAVYKPTAADEGKSFKELQAINGEVFAWLTVYGTNIDYPVAQGQDNMKYVNTSAEGLYSLSGAIFLDYANSDDFSDFNSILYGHHMAKKAMFGEIGDFAEKSVFDANRYGKLYYGGKDHGLEFFAFLHVDAYDSSVFRANVKGEARRQYLDNLLEKASHTRDIGVSVNDRIVLLSTCSSSSTNGRDILIGRISGEVFEEGEAITAETSGGKEKSGADGQDCLVKEIPLALPILIIILTALLIVKILGFVQKRGQNKKQTEGRKT